MPVLAFKMPARVASRPKATKGRTGRTGRGGSRGSGPERRRGFRPQNYSQTPAIKIWRPPIPEPLPPAPLLGPRGLLGLGLLALAQLWGRTAGRPATSAPVPSVWMDGISGQFPAPGNTTPGTWILDRTAGSFSFYDSSACGASTAQTAGDYRLFVVGDVYTVEPFETAGACGPREVGFIVNKGLPSEAKRTAQSTTYGFKNSSLGYVSSFTGAPSVPWAAPTTPVPLPDGWEPEAPPTGRAAVAGAVVVPSMPSVEAPVVPLALPAPGADQTASPPVVRRSIRRPPAFPPTVPAETTPLVNGNVLAPVLPPIPATDPGVVFPIPGQPGIPGNGPQPDLPSMAQELGRIERKLEAVLNPGGDANPLPEWANDLGDALNFARMLYELFTATQAGGTYTLSSPCVLDENDERVPVGVNYEGDLGWLGVLSNKIDALAELQQVAKDLKQPICKHKPVGQPVQVTFVEQLP